MQMTDGLEGVVEVVLSEREKAGDQSDGEHGRAETVRLLTQLTVTKSEPGRETKGV